jgi:energy-converting hydrogenase Eha subunit G
MAGLGRRRGMDVQLAELAAEGQVLILRQMLVAEEDHQVLGQRAVDLVHLAVADLAQIDAADLAADDRRQLVDVIVS